MLNSVRVQRFKSLSDVTLEFGDRLTVLVGPNNAGKSSLLQAIQFGVSIVQSIRLDGSGRWSGDALAGTLSADQLVYTPLRDVQMLAHGGSLRQSAESAIIIDFANDGATASIAVRRGKNKNVSINCAGKSLLRRLESLEQPFSVIAPGLAGIPSFEEFRSEGIVRRAAARGDANSVFRNVLWILRNDPVSWELFQTRLHAVFPDVAIDVSFDPASDEHLRATITRNGAALPIDASGTGILQAAQVLAYVGVYAPRLLILDEPDAHLHPDNQRKLVRLLHELAEEEDFQVLMSTHSRHMLDESVSIGATTHWVTAGAIDEAPAAVLEMLMALGALDAGDRLRAGATEWVVLTEDAKLEPLRAVLHAAGFSDDSTSIWSYASCTQLGAATALGRFIADNAPGTKVLVHLDRDYMGEDTFEHITTKLLESGLQLFTTPGTDIESFFLNVDHLSAVYSDQPRDAVESLLATATEATREPSMRSLINARVDAANQRRKNGESQPNVGALSEQAHKDYNDSPERLRHGKTVLKRLNALAQEQFGKVRPVFVPSNGLPVDALRELRLSTASSTAIELEANPPTLNDPTG